MFAKALVAFLVLPGVVAGLVPSLIVHYDPGSDNGHWIGFILAAIGLVLLLWCVRDFYVSGKGTLAPWSPPQIMVAVGLYRLVRNPMYVAVVTILVGWYALSGSYYLLAYAVAIALMFHVRVVGYEEPWLMENFPQDWARYSQSVNRWWPRIRPWSASGSDN